MPREPRVVAVGAPHHITQRGNARQDVFLSDSIRRAYLRLLGLHAAACRLRILAYCLMTNHVHIVAIPDADTSMANTLRHAHGRFSQYWNTERNRIGHLWQNRYYSCPVEESAAGRVIAYVENNPVRAGLVDRAEDFEWSSARAHSAQADFGEMLDRDWWQPRWSAAEWRAILENRMAGAKELRSIREATYTGRPFGSAQFVAGLEQSLGRRLDFGRTGRSRRTDANENQMAFWIAE
jgi:putative transposase